MLETDQWTRLRTSKSRIVGLEGILQSRVGLEFSIHAIVLIIILFEVTY
jgi:hypothetical protein